MGKEKIIQQTRFGHLTFEWGVFKTIFTNRSKLLTGSFLNSRTAEMTSDGWSKMNKI